VGLKGPYKGNVRTEGAVCKGGTAKSYPGKGLERLSRKKGTEKGELRLGDLQYVGEKGRGRVETRRKPTAVKGKNGKGGGG